MKLLLDIITYGFGNVLPRALGFLLLPLFTRYLSPEDYGIVALLSSLAIIANPLLSLGLGAGLAPQYFRPEYTHRRQDVIWTALWLVGMASTATLIILTLAQGRIGSWLGVPPGSQDGFFLGVCALAGSAVITPLQGNLQFSGRARAFSALAIVTAIATFGLSIILVVVMRRGVTGWFEGMLGGQTIALGLAAILNRSLGPPRWDAFIARRLITSGLALMPASFLIYLLQNGNKWLLQLHHGLAELGIYNVALNIGLLLNLVAMSIQSAWFPTVMARRDAPEEVLAENMRMLMRLALGLGLLNLLLGAAARPIVAVMTSPTFHHAHPLIALSANAHVWAGLFYVAIIPLYFDGRENHQSVILGATALLYVALSWWLVPVWAGYGCAIATVVAFAAATFFAVGYTCVLRPTLRSILGVLAPRLVAIGSLWIAGALLLAWESFRPAMYPWFSAMVCLGAPPVAWCLLPRVDRMAVLALRKGARKPSTPNI